MTDQSLFTKTEEAVVVAPATPTQTETPSLFNDQLNMIKNDSGEVKYDSVPKALEALQHSQKYIPEIKSQLSAKDEEIAALKEQLSKSTTLDEVVGKFTASQGQAPEVVQPATIAPLDEQAVIKMMNDHSNSEKQRSIAEANESSVSKSLMDKFGDKASEALNLKASELGMSVEAIQQLAQQSPQAVIQMFGAAKAEVQQVQPSVSIPLGQPNSNEEVMPTVSLLRGGTYKDQLAYMKQVKAEVYKKFDVQT